MKNEDLMINKREKLKIKTIIITTIIGFVLFIANETIGNPISAAIATSKIKSYVAETYSNQDFEMAKVRYSFSFNNYNTEIKSKVSQDTKFSISYKNGRIFDNYKDRVTDKSNTKRRFNINLSKVIRDIVEKELSYYTSLVGGSLFSKDNNFNCLTLDMPFDINNIPLPIEVNVWSYSEEISYDILANRLFELHKVLQEHGSKVDYYTMTLLGVNSEHRKNVENEEGSEQIYVFDFPASKITEDGLASIIKEHQNSGKVHHMNILKGK